MKEFNLSEEMEVMFEYVKASENEVVKKGLQDYFNVMEKLHDENVFLHDKIIKQRSIIEKQEQEKFRIISESRKSKFEKLLDKITSNKMFLKQLLRSEKSGF